jgi:hypothetical protein
MNDSPGVALPGSTSPETDAAGSGVTSNERFSL